MLDRSHIQGVIDSSGGVPRLDDDSRAREMKGLKSSSGTSGSNGTES
jgi:hypothetical protein